jgi:hypothetical protein
VGKALPIRSGQHLQTIKRIADENLDAGQPPVIPASVREMGMTTPKSYNTRNRPVYVYGKRSHHSPTGIFHLGRKTSNREKYFSPPLLTVNPAGSFHTASRFVRKHGIYF